ncbi:MAG: choice-of-anchor J domain-containing protein, partial [Candidatus Cloacimonetes bacterium]|nr:choice-of-anchor J domain-containing protein [Candidatus Cloacimonadota bacterium]
MKRMKLIFTFIILATSLSFLYAGWDFVAGGYISKIDFVGNNGWAVLSEGLVIHTPDGGTTWEYQQTATSERLYDVSFVDNLEGWVAGNDGLIFHTTDGGNSWIQQNSTTTTNLQSVNFVDALNGWAAGSYGEIVHTSDGGATWSAQTSGIGSKIYSIYFVDTLNGWAVAGSDYIIHTTDGGATWTTQTNPTTDSMKDVIFYDANEGWAAGQHSIIHTVDGGATWVEQANPGDENFYGIGMGDNNHLWVVGIDGEILATTDGGTTWIEQSFSLDWFLGAYFTDSLTGWIVGSGGVIYKTTDGGTTWIAQQAGTSSGLRRTVFVDEDNVWGCGTKGFIIHSGDGGLTWESKESGFDDWIWDITFAPDLLHGWAACDDQTGETPILATVDGGDTWTQQLTGIYEDIVGIEAVSTTEVFAAAKSGIIIHTTDGGTTWNQQTSGVYVDFKSIEMMSEDVGWIVGADGIILYTDNGGTTWVQQTSGTTENIYDVSFVDLLNGWAVGYNGVILHTTDGGTTWSFQSTGTDDDFTRLSVIDANEVWAVADDGFHTTDGGLTWTTVPIPCSLGLWGVDFANSDLGIAMGNGGIVTRYTSVTLNPPQNLFVTDEGYATWDAPGGGGSDFYEDFEGTFPPDGWLKLNPDGGTGWEPLELGTTPLPGWTGGEATACPNGGQWQAYATWTTGGASFNDQWIITPQITVQADDVLDFYMVYYYDSYADYVEILISTTVQNDPAAFDTVVGIIEFPVGSPTDWAAYSYNLTDFVTAGTDVYIGFREYVADNLNDGSAISLDNVYVGQPTNMMPVIPVIAQKETCVERAVNYVHVPNTHVSTVSTRDLLGYNVYLDGVFVTFTTDQFYQYLGLNNGQTYLAEVT